MLSLTTESPQHPADDEACVDYFLADLLALSKKYSLGIAGTAVIFAMEPGDMEREYRLDSNSNLALS